MAEIKEFLKRRQAEGLLRSLRPITRRRKERICSGGREYIDFCSNDYLGLSGHPELIEAAKQALDEFGTASCASRLMSGDLEIHHALEEKTAGFKGKEAALIFNSGYQANSGIISSLFGKGDCIYSDRLNHASIVDGILLSGARLFRFHHNDAGHLRCLLEKERNRFKKSLIVTESIFSMDADRPPLRELVELKDKYNCLLMADEAHATGVFGGNGSGVINDEGLEDKVDLIMGTFSKALAGFGAYLAASKNIIDYLINVSREFIYSTALPPALIACNLKSIELIEKEPYRREKLLENARFFREALKAKGFQVIGCSQIVPLIAGENQKAVEFAGKLRQKGYWVLPVRHPTVPKHQARLRLSLTFYHDKEILQKFVDDIGEIKV